MTRKASLIPFIVVLATLFASMGAASPATAPARVPASFTLTDADGTARRPLEAARTRGATGVVFLFIAVDCPISNSYSPEINRICMKYGKTADGTSDGAFDFYFVHADPDLAPADAKKHASDYGYGCPVLMDAKKELTGLLGATVTPEAFVLSSDGSVLYQGRIDDRYVDYGKARAEPTTRDLRDALDAVAAGKPVANRHTKVIGCPL